MNNIRRKQIAKVIDALEWIREDIDSIHAEEEEAFDNMPESLEGTDRYDAMADAVSNLEDAVDLVEELIEALENAKE